MPGYRICYSDLDAVHPKYFCPCCGFLLRDAIQTSCGDLYCQSCLINVLSQPNPVCLGCRASLEAENDPFQVFADNFVRREILELETSCLNKDSGCIWQGKVKEVDCHHCSCEYKPVPCRNDGCTITIPRCQLALHEQQECSHRLVVCQHCSSPETFGGLQGHLEMCPNVPVSCANCGMENIQRNQLNRHSDPFSGDCTRNYCPLRYFGCACDELMSHEALIRHLADGLDSHLALVVRLFEGGSNQNNRGHVGPLDGSLRQDLRRAEANIEAHNFALSTHYRQLGELGSEVKRLIDTLAGVGTRLDQVSTTTSGNIQEMSTLRNRVERLETTVARQDETINLLIQLIGIILYHPHHPLQGRARSN